MVDEGEIRHRWDPLHQQNTLKVLDMLTRDLNLNHLDKVVDPGTAEIYKRLIPRYAELMQIEGRRPLNEEESGELFFVRGSLFHNFGREGAQKLARTWGLLHPVVKKSRIRKR